MKYSLFSVHSSQVHLYIIDVKVVLDWRYIVKSKHSGFKSFTLTTELFFFVTKTDRITGCSSY